MKKLLLIALLIVGCVFGREYIAIIDFEGIGVSDDDAKALTQRLTTEMIKLEIYQVLERSEMKRLLEEQKFQYSGCVDLNCAVELGKMLGAKYMVVGSISKVGRTYSIDSRLIDVKTSESYVSASYSMKGEIDGLMDNGMKSISYQLCELPYTETNNTVILADESKGAPIHKTLNSTTKYIAYHDDTIPTKRSNMILNDYYYKGHHIELKDNTNRYGNYLGTNSNILYFVGVGIVRNIDCNIVANVYDGKGINISFDCSKDTFFPNH